MKRCKGNFFQCLEDCFQGLEIQCGINMKSGIHLPGACNVFNHKEYGVNKWQI